MLVTAAFAVIALIVVGGAFYLTHQSSTPPIAPITPTILTPSNIASDGRTLGQANAPVTVDLYGDFRCSQCLAFTIEGDEAGLVKDYVATGQARLVWHDLITIDQTGETASRDAANAAWCAADQGKFWLMHDWLYANQGPSEDASYATPERLSAIAKAANLDMTKWQPCFDSGTHNEAIAQETSSAPSDAGGTPALYIKGKLITFTSYSDFTIVQTAMDAALGIPGPCASPSPTGSPTASPSGSASGSATASPTGSPAPSPTACTPASPSPGTSASPTPTTTAGPTPSTTP
jgi:protein-disulfide isomerase